MCLNEIQSSVSKQHYDCFQQHKDIMQTEEAEVVQIEGGFFVLA